MFKRTLPTEVEIVLSGTTCKPGDEVGGQVRVKAAMPLEFSELAVSLTAAWQKSVSEPTTETDADGNSYSSMETRTVWEDYDRQAVRLREAGSYREGEEQIVDFSFVVPPPYEGARTRPEPKAAGGLFSKARQWVADKTYSPTAMRFRVEAWLVGENRWGEGLVAQPVDLDVALPSELL